MAELLLELLSEEIPSRMQEGAAEQLRRLVCKALDKDEISYTDARAYVTPRRLALVVEGLPTRQPDRRSERKGPRTDAPEKAIQGFLGSVGLTLAQCEIRQIEGKGYYFAVRDEPGRSTGSLLGILIFNAITAIDWQKSMRWTDNRFPWIRPLHGILAIFDGDAVEGVFRLGHGGSAPTIAGFATTLAGVPTIEDEGFTENFIEYKADTVGHRFLAPEPFKVKHFKDYEAKLRRAHVMLDAADRRDAIWRGATKAAGAKGLTVRQDKALLAEVAGLVEWPSVLMGAIDPDFMDVPPEVLTTSMRTHQKFFAVTATDGALAPHFIAVANMPASDTIRRGYERVLRARLADAKYFWDRDRKVKLESRVPALEGIVFHGKLGTVAEKGERMAALAENLAQHIPGADPKLCRRAAYLAKADLTTEMVGEFPGLQGIMGRYYALADGEDGAVADAIAEHYSPVGPNDVCPTKPASVAVALADKVDTLVGFWAIDEKPTGSKDPYALRRAALGIIRLILENDIRVSLTSVLRAAMRQFETESRNEAIIGELLDFFSDRLVVQQRDKGVRHDMLQAVFAVRQEKQAASGEFVGDVYLHRVLRRVQELGELLGTQDGANLLTAYRRAANIVRIEERKDGEKFEPATYDPKLAEGKEADLWQVLERTGSKIEPLIENEKFADAMAALAQMRAPVDDFFDNVTVNVEETDIRRNRLRLLANITSTMNKVADFSRIEGGER